MIAEKLLRLLQEYPPNTEVWIEVEGVKAHPTDVDWEVYKGTARLIITDYPIERKDEESRWSPS